MNISLSERDSKVIWHPYTQHKNMQPPIAIESASGTLLFDMHGKSYIDAISSWWVNIHGHSHPYIAKKIFEQASRLDHVIFTGFTHEPAVLLAERLTKILPGNFSRVFYSDNGSTAVEVAVKMALQYWKNKGNSDRKKILSLDNAYHGDTFGAMSVSERSIFTAPFVSQLFSTTAMPAPMPCNIQETIDYINHNATEYAAFIYEPLLQGAGGMLMYDAAALDEVLAAVKNNDILCIADEVLTGFGRTGKFFAGEYLNNKADIICLSKGLTGGAMAMGVTASTAKVFDAFADDDRGKTFFHGHSFTANPIACASALASLDLLEDASCLQQIERVTRENNQFVEDLKHNAAGRIKNIRQLGTIVAFELNSGDDGYLNAIGPNVTKKALEDGIYLRTLGNTIYIMPPYCITGSELEKVYDFVHKIINPADK